jgi:hypothetical protein
LTSLYRNIYICKLSLLENPYAVSASLAWTDFSLSPTVAFIRESILLFLHI